MLKFAGKIYMCSDRTPHELQRIRLLRKHATRHVICQVSHSFVNPYKVLQVSEDADPKQIKRAYRKLALRC